jgi:hypothetical protein
MWLALGGPDFLALCEFPGLDIQSGSQRNDPILVVYIKRLTSIFKFSVDIIYAAKVPVGHGCKETQKFKVKPG